MSTIVNFWPDWFRARYGGEWPRTYCCFDLETTGFSHEKDVITEIAHCLVEDGRIVDELALVLDWTNHKVVGDHWLRNRLANLQQGMAQAGNPCHMTYLKMQEEGKPPEKTLAFYGKLFGTLRARGVPVVAHNGYGFDEKMLHASFIGHEIDPQGFSFGDDGLIDTEGLEKASQKPSEPRFQPRPDDTLRSYFHRVRHTRVPGVRSDLSKHCFARYGFDRHGIDPKTMHGALVDSRCLVIMMEEHRRQIDVDAPSDGGSAPRTPAPAQRRPAPPAVAAAVAGTRLRGQRNR